MARNERVGPGWPQPRRSTSSKSHSAYVGCRRAGNLDDLGDIMSLLSNCNKGKNKKEQWPIHSTASGSRSYSAPDCCLKNGRIHCSCLWSKNDFSLDSQSSCKRNYRKAAMASDSILSHERNMPFWHENNNSGHSGGIKMAEEYVLDDNELGFDFYDMPFDMPKRHQLRKVGNVKTVSIIDTLSELASGATDREDEGGFSPAVSESAILGHDPYRSRVKYSRHSSNRRGYGHKENYLTLTPMSNEFRTKSFHRPLLNDSLSAYHESICGSQIQNVHGDDGNFTCSSLKRTLKYLRKAVSSNVVEEEPRTRRHIRRHEEKDAFRQCFSDSEVREVPKPWATVRREKPELNSRSKSRSLLTVTSQRTPEVSQHHTKTGLSSQPRSKVDTPDWIKRVFSAARKGEVEKLKEGLKDIDSALVRNLSDDHGNNLWHICSAQNHVHCLDWLCSHNQQQVEALKDENKHGFTPVALAVKHGSLLSVQWLVHNTVSKAQLSSTGNARSLLHIAAKYGQETTVQWLLSYMNSQEINVNGLDSEGNTALHLAAKHGHINCVKALIFQNGNLKVRNERGLKPINLSVKYSEVNCADYLLAMESCYNLAALNIKQQSELQQLQKENAEVKSYFKELLTLTKRLQHRQRELVQTFTRIDHSGQFDSDLGDRHDKHKKYMDEYSQLLAAVIADEEHRLLLVEDRWKMSRKQPKLPECKKLPLDVIRAQFTHILDKVTDQSPAVPSTPETSDDSWQSEEEDASSLPQSGPSANIIGSTPDVIHALPTQHVPYMGTGKKQLHNSSFMNKHIDTKLKCAPCDISFQKNKTSSDFKTNNVRSVSGSARDVNLQVFFKQNPNLRQTSETCSVLEVLEPSSSDSDECVNSKRSTGNELKSEEELLQSSSSSAAETMSPSSCGPSSTGSKKSGSRSSSNGSKHDVGGARSNMHVIHLSGGGAKSVTDSAENKGPDGASNNNGAADVLNRNLPHSENNCLVEPDLIRGTQKKKRTPPILQLNREERQPKENSTKDTLTDNPSISTEDSESLEADRSFSSAVDGPESLFSGPLVSDSSASGAGVKKKGFLLKFSLRGRWPSKYSRPRSSKNEISAEEFRETYSRSSENAQSPSQISTPTSSGIKKLSPLPVKDSEKSQEVTAVFDNTCSGSTFPSCSDLSRTGIQLSPVGLLPPRREPPPVPPRPPREAEPPQIIPGDDMQIGAINSSSSCVTSCMTESAVSLHDPYMSNSSSNIWQSPDSKSMFRPASSASRVESISRADDSFPLNKSSSASTEMLSALDSSTAGRQSPAPSEVSKTESALSPPSDVSKTESTRYLSQLGRIEESNHLAVIKSSSMQKTSTDETPAVDVSSLKDERSEIKQKKKSTSSRKHNPDKPWYEFSDEEDVITPQRYEVMSGRMRSSSEDEEVIAS